MEQSKPAKIALIVACSENGIIGSAGDLPWHLPDDLRHFMKSTKDHSVIMGRKTYETLDKPLNGRLNIVVSSTLPLNEGIKDTMIVARSLQEGFQIARQADAKENGFGTGLIWVAGGGEIYRQAMGHADLIVRTLVHCQTQGDVSFGGIDPQVWKLDHTKHHKQDDRHAYGFTIEHWNRRNSPSV